MRMNEEPYLIAGFPSRLRPRDFALLWNLGNPCFAYTFGIFKLAKGFRD